MKTVIEMAREAGYESVYLSTEPVGRSLNFLERFAALVREDEREKIGNRFDSVLQTIVSNVRAGIPIIEAINKATED